VSAAPRGQWFDLAYSLVSDDTGRKGGKLSHQVSLAHEHDFGPLGTLGASVWLDFFRNPLSDRNTRAIQDLNEVDYSAYWSHQIDPLATTVTVGWTAQTFPQFTGDKAWTQEVFVTLAVDDRRIFGTKEGLLNPYLGYFQDVDDFPGGWIEMGVSHCFRLADLAGDQAPVLKHLTVSPAVLAAIDHRQLAKVTQLAMLRYGVEIGYDLSSAWKIPANCGVFTVSGFVYYTQAFEDELRPVLFGGLSLRYSL